MPRCQIANGLYHLLGHHVNVGPIFIVLPVFDQRPIDGSKALADLFEAVVVTAVARKVDLARGTLDEERRPEGIAGMQGASREMLRGQAVEFDAVSHHCLLVPVQFRDAVGGISPSFEVFADTKRTNHPADAPTNGFHGAVVEMIIVIVGDDERVYGWKILDLIAVCPFEGGKHPREGRGSFENGINEEGESIGAEKHGRVSEPDQGVVIVARQRIGRGVDNGERIRRFETGGTVEKKIAKALYKRL